MREFEISRKVLSRVARNEPAGRNSFGRGRLRAGRSLYGLRRSGFTLLEMMVTLSLLMVMLAIIFIPLTNAFEIFNTGRSKSDLQAAADQTVKSIAAEVQGAVAVFPNAALPGVTDHAPYTNGNTPVKPYFAGTACSATRVEDTARIDFIAPRRYGDVPGDAPGPGDEGTVLSDARPANTVVSFYARLLKPNEVWDQFSNPLLIYRAQMPYLDSSRARIVGNGIDVSKDRYGSSCSDADWLVKKAANPTTAPFDTPAQSDLSNQAVNEGTVQGSHTLAMPINMALAPIDRDTLRPDLSFDCEDTDRNGIIDRVTIRLTLIQYEEGNTGRNGLPNAQRVTATKVVDLPNTRLRI